MSNPTPPTSTYLQIINDKTIYYIIRDTDVLSPKSENTPFLWDGKLWQSLLHFYFALVFPKHSEYLRSLLDVDSVLFTVDRLPRSARIELTPPKQKIFHTVLTDLFDTSTNPTLVKHLLSTADKNIIFHSGIDHTLSDRINGSGLNIYGKLLTEVRNKLIVELLFNESHEKQSCMLAPLITEEILNREIKNSISNGSISNRVIYQIKSDNKALSSLLPSSATPFTYGTNVWPTAEHCYQAMKYTSMQNFISQLEISHLRKLIYEDKILISHVRNEFDREKLSIMYHCVENKLTQNPEIKKVLLATHNAFLHYSNQAECYWGCGNDGKGSNFMGKILMSLRKKIHTREKNLHINEFASLHFKFRLNSIDSPLLSTLLPSPGEPWTHGDLIKCRKY